MNTAKAIFRMFAESYPHEAYDHNPKAFMAYAKKKTGRSKAEILAILERTRGNK